MKTLKFTADLTKQILSGKKTSTWRLFDDKDLSLGDEIEFVNKENLETFGKGKIVGLTEKTLASLVESDWVGHERFASDKEMYETYRTYYGPLVDKNSLVKIIHFKFDKN